MERGCEKSWELEKELFYHFFDSIEGALLSYRIGVLRTIVLIKWRIMGYADSCWDGQKKQIKIKYPL